MSITLASIITPLDRHLGDTSTDRISSADRIDAISEAVIWLQEELGNEHQDVNYSLNYYDTLHNYNVTTTLADLLNAVDLRRLEADQTKIATFKSGKDLAEDIGLQSDEFAYSIERVNKKAYLVVNLQSIYPAVLISDFESTTDGGGTWASDTSTSDALSLSVDNADYTHGGGSLTFGITVAQSGNNRATISNSTLTTLDATNYSGISSWLVDFKLPTITNITSFTLYWGSDSSNYWSATVTTDALGNAFAVDWNPLKFDWTSSTTMTGTPDVTGIDYIRLDVNYGAGQTDIVGFKIDWLRLVRPEKLKFYYTSWYVGTNSGGTNLNVFTATTDIPFFSGQYDQYKYCIAHKAAAILLQDLRLKDEALQQDQEAYRALERVRKLIPSSKVLETKTFKVFGNSFNRTNRRWRNRRF